MAYKITYALARGSWEGDVGESAFTRDVTVFSTPEEFLEYKNSEALVDAIEESVSRGEATIQKELSSDGRVFICTMEFESEEVFNYWYSDDIRILSQAMECKCYRVILAPSQGFEGTFDEEASKYYHSSEHLF